MSKPNNASLFLANLKKEEPTPPAPPAKRRPAAERKPVEKAAAATPAPAAEPKAGRHSSREGKTHFGGYVTAETLEIAAVLRVRLKKDNSELITYALEELDRSHKAKRAFGDA